MKRLPKQLRPFDMAVKAARRLGRRRGDVKQIGPAELELSGNLLAYVEAIAKLARVSVKSAFNVIVAYAFVGQLERERRAAKAGAVKRGTKRSRKH